MSRNSTAATRLCEYLSSRRKLSPGDRQLAPRTGPRRARHPSAFRVDDGSIVTADRVVGSDPNRTFGLPESGHRLAAASGPVERVARPQHSYDSTLSSALSSMDCGMVKCPRSLVWRFRHRPNWKRCLKALQGELITDEGSEKRLQRRGRVSRSRARSAARRRRAAGSPSDRARAAP